ncbi:hypothetical protein TNCV_2560411 [Trichonephila clavipes]|uniref:Uncharacterized protein n=1 Tax=Trichonephila clavipes TaxID=2585209 RepID=A0A8X6UY46_TRICX|nr:hypothetical protein TNCV_2560411 [Trichonephila clavipes]
MFYKEIQRRLNSDVQYQWVQPQTKKRSKSGVEKRTQQGGGEDQFESEEAENFITVPTLKSKQGLQVGRPEAEVVNKSIASRGKEERT